MPSPFDRAAIDLPLYDGLLAGHYRRGQGYGRRRPGGTDDWLLVMTLDGEGRFGTSVGDIPARNASLFLISPGTPHDYGIAREAELWEILWVHFQPPADWIDLLQWPPLALGVHSLEPTDQESIRAAFEEVLRTSHLTAERRRRFSMNALERLLLLCDAELPEAPHPMDARIRAAIDHIHGNLRQPLSLEELSRVAHLSPSRFAHLFKAEVGLAPHRYVLLQRLQRARALLERTSLGIAEIAAEIGMEPFHLSLRFKAEFGHAPRDHRRREAGVRG